MATFGSTRVCPQCGQETLEHEVRLNTDAERAECVDCGYFYEKTWVGLLKRQIEVPEGENLDEETFRKFLKENHFHSADGMVFRIGTITKGAADKGSEHVVNTWFQVPSGYARRPTTVTWMTFSEEELAQFDWSEWRGKVLERPPSRPAGAGDESTVG